MRTNKPIVVFVGNDDRATELMEASNTYVLGAPTLRDALAQTIFSMPDAIVIDATPENMKLAEDVFYHLRTIQHPNIVLLSNVPASWDTSRVNNVSILPNETTVEDLAMHLNQVLTGVMEPAS